MFWIEAASAIPLKIAEDSPAALEKFALVAVDLWIDIAQMPDTEW